MLTTSKSAQGQHWFKLLQILHTTPPVNVESVSGGALLPALVPPAPKELITYSRRKVQVQQKQASTPSLFLSSDPSMRKPSAADPSGILPAITPHNSEHISAPIYDDLDLPIAIRKGKRNTYPMSNYLSYDKLSVNHRNCLAKLSDVSIPRDIYEALEDPSWKRAVMEEINALEKNGTWEVVNLPKNHKIVGCKWVFTIKQKADGSIERYKARLVAKGFTQTHGIDYEETFAPVAKLNSIRVLFSLAAFFDWTLHQLDVKNAFLNGVLEETVYMKLPPGFEKGKHQVCKLKKALYGLKQSPRAWFNRFGTVVKGFGYTQSQADHTLFYKHSVSGKISILIVYVDDIIVTGNDLEATTKLKEALARSFEIKDLGLVKYFLGMEVARSKAGIFINQRKYILDLLKETGLLNCKPAETPLDANQKLELAKPEEVVDIGKFQRLVGRLIYLSHTRPDIAFPVSMLSQFMHAPSQKHFEAVYRVVRYLKGTPGKGLLFRKSKDLFVEVYTDADWAGCVNDRRSTSGICTFLGGNLVTWRSKKQSVVARSSAEAEFRALANGICEGLWLKRILEELKVQTSQPIRVYCDNNAAVSIAHNPVQHDRTKHVEVDRHFIKEKIEMGLIRLSYVPSCEQRADILTKGLHKGPFLEMRSKLALQDIFRPA